MLSFKDKALKGQRGGIEYHFGGFRDSISHPMAPAVACWQTFLLTVTHSPLENKHAGMLVATCCVEILTYNAIAADSLPCFYLLPSCMPEMY